MTDSRHETRTLVLLLVGATLIGFAPIFAVLAGQWGEIGPTVTAFWRVALATPVLGLALWWRRRWWRRRWWQRRRWQRGLTPSSQPRAEVIDDGAGPPRWVLLLPGVVFALDLSAWHGSMVYISAGLATLLGNLSVLFVPTVAWFWFKERYGARFFVGAAVALGGTALVMLPPDAAVLGTLPSKGEGYLLGNLLALSTAVLYGSYQLSIKRARRHYSTLTVMFWAAFVCSLLLGPVCWLGGMRFLPVDVRAWWILGALSLFCHCLGQGLIAYCLGHLRAGVVALLLLWQPLAATLFSVVLLGQDVSGLQALGVLVVLAGLAVASLARARAGA